MELDVNPNPAENTITLSTGRTELSVFRVFDILGRIVIDQEVSDQEELDVEHLEPGLYYYKLIAGSRLQTGKLWIKR